MSKFKVGDRVRFIATYPLDEIRGVEAVVIGIDENGIQVDAERGFGKSSERPESLELVTAADPAPAGPTPYKIVTTRHVAAGRYGYTTWRQADEPNEVAIVADGNFTGKDLREAAALFNQIADVLDENARTAA